MKHWGDEIHTNMHKVALCRRDFGEPIIPSAKANLCEVIQCRLEFLTNKVSVVWHVLFPERTVGLQITDSSTTTIE